MTRAAAIDGSRGMRIEKNSDAVFDEAIRRGVLSEDPADVNFAGLYMYMHHDAKGAAWFKHRETRAYLTMRAAPCKGSAPGDRGAAARTRRLAWPGLGFWATAALAGAFLVGALVEFGGDGPRIGTVRLDELTAEFLSEAVRGTDAPEATAEAARHWGTQLEAALESVARRHGVVLLPANAVAAGARDYTGEIRREMRPGTAAPGIVVRDEPASAEAGEGP